MSSLDDQRKDLPAVNAPNFLERVKELLSVNIGARGDGLDRAVTVRDLVVSGIGEMKPGFKGSGGSVKQPLSGPGPAIEPAYEPELTPPPTPINFTATAGITSIVFQHTAPSYTQGHGHSKTVVYGATRATGAAAPVFSAAVPITEFSGNVGDYSTNPSTVWHLWAKWKSVDGVLSASPAGGLNGVVVTTGQDVSTLVKAMTGVGNPFTILATTTIIDGVTFPAGTYSTQAFIQDAQITNAKIANLAVDSAKITSLTASKLTAGNIAVGQAINSASYVPGSAGWSINGNGQAEFSNVVVRGAVFATSGTFAGQLVAATGTFAGQLVAATGHFTGTLAVGLGGRNMVSNSGPAPGSTASYALGFSNTTGFLGVYTDEGPWRPTGGNSVHITHPGTPPAGYVQDLINDNFGRRYPVVAGKRYEFSTYLSIHRCEVYAEIAWFDSAGSYITEASSYAPAVKYAQGALSQWPRSGLFAVAPANAATALVFVRLQTTGESQPYVFASSWYFGEAGANQTEFSPYSPAGQTIIDGTMIRTGSLIANVRIDIRSAASGERMEQQNNYIKIFDANNVKRIHLGDLLA